jgi:hypothetical protein
MSTQTFEDTQERTTAGPNECAHIVKDPAKVAQAYVEGTPVEALCGHTFTPSKNPKTLPVCQMCKELADAFLDPNLGDSGDIQ